MPAAVTMYTLLACQPDIPTKTPYGKGTGHSHTFAALLLGPWQCAYSKLGRQSWQLQLQPKSQKPHTLKPLQWFRLLMGL